MGVLLCMYFVIYERQILVTCPGPFGTFYTAVEIYLFVSPCFDPDIVIYERRIHRQFTIYVANLDIVYQACVGGNQLYVIDV